jgi:hypothetical protein
MNSRHENDHYTLFSVCYSLPSPITKIVSQVFGKAVMFCSQFLPHVLISIKVQLNCPHLLQIRNGCAKMGEECCPRKGNAHRAAADAGEIGTDW